MIVIDKNKADLAFLKPNGIERPIQLEKVVKIGSNGTYEIYPDDSFEVLGKIIIEVNVENEKE